MNYKLYDNFDTILPQWNELIQTSETATVFQTYEFINAWWKIFIKDNSQLFVVAVYKDNNMVGLGLFRKVGSTLTFIGTDKVGPNGDLVTDYGDIVAQTGREKEIWTKIIEAAKENGIKNLQLEFMRESSNSFKFLSGEKYEVSEMMDNNVFDSTPFLELPLSWEEYLTQLPRKERHELKRKIRRLEESDNYEIFSSPNPQEDLGEFIRLHKLSTVKKDVFMSEQMAGFFEALTNSLSAKNIIDIMFMKFNGERVSSVFSFKWKNQYWLYNSGFNRKYEYVSVGFLLKALGIKNAIEKKYNVYNFLRGRERYKYDLGARDEKLYKIDIRL